MAFCDFVVKFDPSKDTKEDISKRILYSVIIKRLKAKKPVVWFIGGDSGEGKSFTALRLQELLLEMQGLDPKEFIDDINVYTPLEYPKKLDALLFDPRLKKVNIITMHEAREIVKAKNWQNFLTQSVADINAQARAVKRLITIIISQFIRDITSDMRYTLNFYSVIRRPKNKPARLYINILWKDDRDLEKPRLKKRKLSGYIVYPNGAYKRYVPKYFEMRKPDKETFAQFETSDLAAKSHIIKKKINDLMAEMQTDLGEVSDRVHEMVNYYAKNQDNIHMIGKTYRGKWKVNNQVAKLHGLTRPEKERFEDELYTRLKKTEVKDAD